jgi:hypothetical protein
MSTSVRVTPLALYPRVARVAMAAYSLAFYPWKTLVPLDLRDLILYERERFVHFSQLRHALRDNRFDVRAEEFAAAFLPSCDARLKQENTFARSALMNRCVPVTYRRQDRPKDWHAVFVTEPLALSSARAQFLGFAAQIECCRSCAQRKSKVKGLAAPAGVPILLVADPDSLVRKTQHPDRRRGPVTSSCPWIDRQAVMFVFVIEGQDPVGVLTACTEFPKPVVGSSPSNVCGNHEA